MQKHHQARLRPAEWELFDDTVRYGTLVVGHGGLHVGFGAVAKCFVEDGFVIVVLTNREEMRDAVAAALAEAARSD